MPGEQAPTIFACYGSFRSDGRVRASFSPSLIRFIEVTFDQTASLEAFIRVHLIVIALQLMLFLFALLYIYPVSGLEKRILLYFILVESFILCLVWVIDDMKIQFRSEESSITFFTSLVLFLCSTTSSLNYNNLMINTVNGKRCKLFWFILAVTFLFAGMDESLGLHEKISEMINDIAWFNDLITALYVLGALLFVAIFHGIFKENFFEEGRYFLKILYAGIISLIIAMFFDSFDFLFGFLDGYIDIFHLFNSLEELMEFTAATLFLCAFVVNLCRNRRSIGATIRGGDYVPNLRLRRLFWLSVCLLGVAAAGIKIFYGIGDEPIIFENGFSISVIADASNGLEEPDGLFYSPDHGLMVGNEKARNILVFGSKGKGRVFADGGKGLMAPEAIVEFGDSVFISDDLQKKVLEFSGRGRMVGFAVKEGLKSPEGVAVDAGGALYVADEELSMVVKYSGQQRQVVASALDGLKTPEELAFDDHGNLYITDEEAGAVFKVSPYGKTIVFADRSNGLLVPEGIAVNGGRIYVTDNLKGIIFRFELDGRGGKYITFSQRYRSLS